jgi:hypothetical protein
MVLCAWCEGYLVGFDFITLPTLKMHGQTQIKDALFLNLF